MYPGAVEPPRGRGELNDVVDDFRELTLVLAHGGRGWAYDVAAVLALGRPNVWIEISGLPPKRLPEYFARFDLARLAERFIFGTDWPGVPGIRANAEAVVDARLRPGAAREGLLPQRARRLRARAAELSSPWRRSGPFRGLRL